MITNSAYTEVSQSGTMDTSNARTLEIDASGIAAIVSTLTNQYSDPAMAAVREYSCNARDSHVEAGKKHLPIEVTLPTEIDPQLRIQDYGIGLSRDGILNTYAKYGASTKRHSNDLIGAMGIGSKAGFTVGNQFTVAGVKDGVKTIALFALNAHGEPTVDILAEMATDEPNGVLVDIGVEDIQAVRNAASKLFYTWDQGTVHVDGERPEHVWTNTNVLGVDSYLFTAEYNLPYGQSPVTFVMGGVPYLLNAATKNTLPQEQREWLASFDGSKARFYIDTPIGSVDITPSREDLRVTRHTTETVTAAIKSLMVTLPKWISEEVESATTFTEAAMLVRKLGKTLGWSRYEGLTWKGRKFDTKTVTLDHPNFYLVKKGRGYYDDKAVTKLGENTTISIDQDFDKITVVTGVPEGKYSTVRRYVKVILTDRDEDANSARDRMVIASTLKEEEKSWFAYGDGGPVETVSFEDWRDLGRKLMKIAGNTGGPRSETTYNVVGEDDAATASEINALGLPVAVYAYKSHHNTGNKIVVASLEDYLIVKLSKGQQMDAFLKRVPGARQASDVTRAHANHILNTLTTGDKAMLQNNKYLAAVNSSHVSFLATHQDKITNQSVLDYLEFHAAAKDEARGDSERLNYLQIAANIVGRSISDVPPKHANFVGEHLPFVGLYVSQTWYANNVNNDKQVWVNQLVEYINSIVIDVTF
jgi:hypothetical protein